MPLSHFSEDPTIARFVLRPPLARPTVEPLVWAIDEWHAPLYFLPARLSARLFLAAADDHAG